MESLESTKVNKPTEISTETTTPADLKIKEKSSIETDVTKQRSPESSSTLSLSKNDSQNSNSSLSTVIEKTMEPDDHNEISQRASMDHALKSEKAFIEYVMSLPVTSPPKDSPSLSQRDAPSVKLKQKSSAATTVAVNTSKVGLDHLDNLCKLMEQLSDLRETNTKLQKRVQYLEDLKTLHDMHKEIKREVQYGSENVLNNRKKTSLKKSLTGSEYARSSPRGSEDSNFQTAPSRQLKSRRSPSGRRSRATTNPTFDGRRRERSKSVGHEEIYDEKPRRIFPTWSKVKEAFGWESEKKDSAKATNKVYFANPTNTTISREQFLGANRRVFTDADISALRIPLYSEYSEKEESFPVNANIEEESDSMGKYDSSAEDVSEIFEGFTIGTSSKKRDSDTSDKRLSLLEPPEGLRRQKSTPSPGSDRVRNYHETLDLKPKSLTIERDIDPEQAFAKYEKEDAKKSHKSPWGRVKTIIEKRRDSLKRKHLRRGLDQGNLSPYQRQPTDINMTDDADDDPLEGTVGCVSRRKSSDDQFLAGLGLANYSSKDLIQNEDGEKSARRKKQISIQEREDRYYQDKGKINAPLTQSNSAQRFDQFENRDKDQGVLTPSSSPPLHRKSRWTRVKKVLRGKKEDEGANAPSFHSMPSSPNGIRDSTFDFEDTDALEEASQDLECYPNMHEVTRVGSDSHVHKLSLSSSAPVSNIMLELQRNLSEDFNRKMQEWERIRSDGVRPTATSPKWERKNSGSKSRKKTDKQKSDRIEKCPKPKVKDLTWLEKELQKIEKEKQRLSKEKEKYEERALRLQKLKETVLTARNSNKKEVLVRTSAGEFRFEGISDAFTKKLYEWETKRGLGPELSTIALLDSSLGTGNKNCFITQPKEKCGNIQRGVSRSESSLAEIGQPSHTSSNSLPSLKHPESGEIERIHHSRANSEPDLSAIVSIKNSNNVSMCTVHVQQNGTPTICSQEFLEIEPKESYAHPDVTQLIDSDVDEVLGDLEERTQESEQREENYYSLLEENVILLEQLKNKEEICRRLEKELGLLDEKVDEMNKHHQAEMEKYREKLWEMHKPGNTPREIQGCLQMMSELRSRIEKLEKCSERLKNDRENLEDSFRFHSAEQEHMTLDLLDKMRELHAAGEGSQSEKIKKNIQQENNTSSCFDMKTVERLQDLSSQLVKQTRELEQTLAERTRQICQLRWELLHRDVSTVRLETELHSAHIRGSNTRDRSKCEEKRSKYAHFRSWSSEEASSRSKRDFRSYEVEHPVQNLQNVYYDKLQNFQASELSSTVQELNRELIRLSTAAESYLEEENVKKEEENRLAAEKENATRTENVEYTLDPKMLQKEDDGDSKFGSSSSLAQKNEALAIHPRISVRRNSAGHISIDTVGSESSNISELLRSHPKNLPKLYRKESKSSSSDSESLSDEEYFTRVLSCPIPPRNVIPLQSIMNCSPLKDRVKKDKPVENENFNSNSITISSRKPLTLEKNSSSEIFPNKTNDNNFEINNLFNFMQYQNSHIDSLENELSSNSSLEKPNTINFAHSRGTQLWNQKEHKFDTEHPTLPKKQLFNLQSTSDSKIPQKLKIEMKKSQSFTCKENETGKNREKLGDNKEHKSFHNDYNYQESRKLRKSSNKGKCQNASLKKSKMCTQESDNDSSKRADEIIGNNLHCSSDNLFKDLLSASCEKQNQATSSGKLVDNQKFYTNESRIEQETKTNYLPQNLAIRNTEPSTVTIKLPKKRRKSKIADSKSAEQHGSERHDFCSASDVSDSVESVSNTIIVTAPTAVAGKSFCALSNDNINNLPVSKLNVTREKEQAKYQENNSECKLDSDLHRFCENKSENSGKCSASDNSNTFSTEFLKLTSCDIDSTKKTEYNFHSNNANTENSRYFLNKSCEQDTNFETTVAKVGETYFEEGEITDFQEKKLKKEICTATQETTSEPNKKYFHEERENISKKSQNNRNEGYVKSPSAPQLDWKKMCAKKISREGAPNVKNLIEKYNQRVLENQSPKSGRSSALNSPVTCRKSSAPIKNTEPTIKNIPFSSTPNSPRIISASAFYSPLTFKPANLDIFQKSITSPPTSPASRARSEALQKAKEKFISSSNVVTFEPPNQLLFQHCENKNTQNNELHSEQTVQTTKNFWEDNITPKETQRSATDSDLNRRHKTAAKKSAAVIESESRASSCSNKSMDSMSLVMFKTGETCQESRLSRRTAEVQKREDFNIHCKPGETGFQNSKSLSNSSLFKTVTGHDFKLPASFLRLKRSRKKKDMATVSQLCRQSLVVCEESTSFSVDKPEIYKSPRSCPSSPELKTKSKNKTSWLHRSFFRHK